MTFHVELTHAAADDLADIIDWITHGDSVEAAVHVLDQIETRIDSLERQPGRGVIPHELRALGIDRYRELFFGPHRIIYQVRDKQVVVHLIADGRRDMLALLQRRLTSTR